MSERSDTVTITLPVPTASLLLGALMDEHAQDNSWSEVYSRKWHREKVIEAVKTALLNWP